MTPVVKTLNLGSGETIVQQVKVCPAAIVGDNLFGCVFGSPDEISRILTAFGLMCISCGTILKSNIEQIDL